MEVPLSSLSLPLVSVRECVRMSRCRVEVEFDFKQTEGLVVGPENVVIEKLLGHRGEVLLNFRAGGRCAEVEEIAHEVSK